MVEEFFHGNRKKLSPLEQLRQMEEELFNKHKPLPEEAKQYSKKPRREKLVKNPIIRRKKKPNHRYGQEKTYQIGMYATPRARRFIDLMGGITAFIENAAIQHELYNPDLYLNLNFKKKPKKNPETE